MKRTRRMGKGLLAAALFIGPLLAIALAGSSVAQADGPVSWWRAELNATDSADGNNSGTLEGGTTFAPGQVGFAFSLDGVDDFVQVADADNLQPAHVTVAAWINTSTIPGTEQEPIAPAFIVARSGIAGANGYELSVNYGTGKARADMVLDGDNTFGTVLGTTNVVDGTWHHLAATYDGEIIKVYVDCMLEGSTTYTFGLGYTPGDPLLIGKRQRISNTSHINALLDEVKLYNRALSEAEIAAMFEAESHRRCPATTGEDVFGEAVFLVIDEDSIDNGTHPNYFSAMDVNDHIARVGLRAQLPFFAANVGDVITLRTGKVGDEGWFALKTIPESWTAAGPTTDGLRNYLGNPSQPSLYNVGPGLGTPDANGNREALLYKIPDLTPLRAAGLKMLEGEIVCAVVYDNDISIINYNPLKGSLKGANLGTVAFQVISVAPSTKYSSSSLPQVEIEILDTEEVCGGSLRLFTEAPEPVSPSDPCDVVPEGYQSRSRYQQWGGHRSDGYYRPSFQSGQGDRHGGYSSTGWPYKSWR